MVASYIYIYIYIYREREREESLVKGEKLKGNKVKEKKKKKKRKINKNTFRFVQIRVVRKFSFLHLCFNKYCRRDETLNVKH